MSMTAVIILMAVIVVIIIIILVYINRAIIMQQVNNAWANVMGKSSNDLSQEALKNLSVTTLTESDPTSVEVHYKYTLHPATDRRVVVVVAGDESNSYMNDQKLVDTLQTSGEMKSLVGYSTPSSKSDVVRVVRPKDSTQPEPKVYVGWKGSTNQRVVEVDEDLLDGI